MSNVSSANETAVNYDNLNISSDVMRALAHPLRIKMLEFISNNPKVNVNKIYHNLGLEQSITSQHLKILRDSGLVLSNRSGKFIHYTVNFTKVAYLTSVIERFF